MAKFESEGTFAYPNLLAGDYPRITRLETIVSGAGDLAAGTVLGKITASGKLTPVDDAAGDGSQAPHCVLAEDADASAADAEAVVYYSGEFNENALVFGGDDTIADHRDALRDLGIFAKKNTGA